MMERLSVLVLDGDPASLSTISETLTKLNFRVFPFQTVEAALDFARCGAAKEADLDLVLVEVNLNNMAPGTSANSDLLQYILNELQVPLTTMCSCDDREALSKYMNLAACIHVLKPLDSRSFSSLWHQALEHKSKKAAPQGQTLKSTKNRMVSSSTEKPKEVLIPDRNDLSDSESNGYEEPKKRNRLTWTVELHDKFLEAVEVLGGVEYATPEGILHQMNMKGLTVKHISSHLQKHRLRHRNAKQGGQSQENAFKKPIPELIILSDDEDTSESIAPRVETDGEVYPSRMWTEMKKKSGDTAALNTDMYTCTYGNYREEPKSLWDKYENNMQGVFSEKKKRWQFLCGHQWPRKNNIVITDEGYPNKGPKTAGGASIEISGSSSLKSDQVGENNRVEPARANDNVGNINLLEGTSGSGILLTSDQVRQNGYAEATRDNDNLGSINLPQEISGSSNMVTSNQVVEKNHTEFARDNDHMENINMLEENAGSRSLLISDQVGQNNLTEAARNNDTMGNINFLEGIVYPEYVASMDFSVASAHLESNGLDPAGPSDGREEAWDDALISAGLTNILDEPMTEEAAVGGSQDQQSIAPEVLQTGDNAWGDDLRSAGMVNLLNEPITQEATIGDALVDDRLWAWSPAEPKGDYGMLF